MGRRGGRRNHVRRGALRCVVLNAPDCVWRDICRDSMLLYLDMYMHVCMHRHSQSRTPYYLHYHHQPATTAQYIPAVTSRAHRNNNKQPHAHPAPPTSQPHQTPARKPPQLRQRAASPARPRERGPTLLYSSLSPASYTHYLGTVRALLAPEPMPLANEQSLSIDTYTC